MERKNRETKYTGKIRPAPIKFDEYDEIFFRIRDINRTTLLSPKFLLDESEELGENVEATSSGDVSNVDLRQELLQKDCMLRDLDIEYRRRELYLLNLKIARFENKNDRDDVEEDEW